MSNRASRRGFMQTTAGISAGYFIGGSLTGRAEQSPSEKIRIAGVGVGGKGDSDISQAGMFGDVVAICDIDEGHLESKAAQMPKAKKYFDFRKMLEEMDKSIDAVVVSTPDHTHAVAAAMAMRLGKHVYCQKPLTYTVKEARVLRELANEKKVCTQMGNQGTAHPGLRTGVEVIRSGAIGDVTELHVWTNRPVWPQSPSVTKRPSEVPIPPSIHWDEFIGPAPYRPFGGDKNQRGRYTYHPFNWRGWWDFGTGALGDMGCHTANMAFMALKLGYPSKVSGSSEAINPETYPGWAHVVLDYPARDGMVPVKFHWYEGKLDGKLVHPPEELQAKVLRKGEKLVSSGSIMVGTKGILYSPNDYGADVRLCPEKEFDGFKNPEKTLPRNKRGDDAGQKEEWIEAIRKNDPKIAMSNFNYASVLTESLLLGNVAIKLGKPFEYDGATMSIKDIPGANDLLHREYRKGWTL
jgi:predicted dehydrogenase